MKSFLIIDGQNQKTEVKEKYKKENVYKHKSSCYKLEKHFNKMYIFVNRL